ncbi:MAG TPA: hypothetical protein VIY69_04365 [Candidatus Acidoferrales bacterium]
MSRVVSRIFALFITLTIVLAFSAVVRAKDAGNKGSISSTLDVLTPVTLAGTSIAPGTYTVKADGTSVTFLKGGKTVAQASVEWKDSPQKAQSTSLLADQGSVKEIHFSGKTRYASISGQQVGQGTAPTSGGTGDSVAPRQ